MNERVEGRGTAPTVAGADGGEMGTLMRSIDWSKTRLGPIDAWPSSLRTMLGVVLGSRFPMLLWWGPDLLHLYNDAYRPILRDKHPASLGAPAAEVWAEIWDVAGPLAHSVMNGGPATWTEDLQLFINSDGRTEETYFTFSYSPVPGDDGRVGGILNTVQETTRKVQGERQVRMLHELAARAGRAHSPDDAHRAIAEVLSTNDADVPFALVYKVAEGGAEAELVAQCGCDGAAPRARPARVRVDGGADDGAWPLAAALRAGHHVVVDDLAQRCGPLPVGRFGARPERALVLPLARAGDGAPGTLLVVGVSPHRALDERYQDFFRATADQAGAVVATATAYEAERRRAEALAEVDRVKTAFFSNVSHEFRTPLTLILGHLEAARARTPAALQGAEFDAVHRSAVRLLRLVNSLLDFSRIEAGRMRMAVVPTDLARLTTDIASSFRSLVERAGLRFVIDCAPLAAPIDVDPAQWEKIVLNLLSNAFKFTHQGEIAVELRRSGDEAVLTVRDTGIGIPAQELPHVFERFHRVEGARGRSFEGTGIGLSLVEQLVKLHGGRIEVASEEGRGTAFTVTIPASSSRAAPATAAATASADHSAPHLVEASLWIDPDASPLAAETVPGAGQSAAAVGAEGADATGATGKDERARILVVDDNADMRAYLTRLLAGSWRVELAADGRVALQKARHLPPDLVLSDVMMPELNGVELLRALRAHPRTSHVPVVLLSARAGEDEVLEGLDTGADDYLVKPFAARELLARIRTHVELARLRRSWSAELENANRELEAFGYSVSHDLRAPLRAIDGFSRILLSDHAAQLDAAGRGHLERVRGATQRMGQLIDDLLSLSRITRLPMQREPVNVAAVAREVAEALRERHAERRVEFATPAELPVRADPRLLRILLENLVGNAWKFTSKTAAASIEVGGTRWHDADAFFVRDNGAGFDMEHAKRLFAPFQRLHSDRQFEGTGIGLATVQRIVQRHGGLVWAEAAPERGATFFFTLGTDA
ncbi:MAG: response regulator [Planctomycetota bacterium]|nr:MAG: response regulator [Planctomycetota bacterium]